jgi:hypothetical protein
MNNVNIGLIGGNVKTSMVRPSTTRAMSMTVISTGRPLGGP